MSFPSIGCYGEQTVANSLDFFVMHFHTREWKIHLKETSVVEISRGPNLWDNLKYSLL